MKLLLITLHADPTIHPGAVEGGGTHMYVNEIIDMLTFKNIETLILTRKASPGKDIAKYGSVTIFRLHLGPEDQWDKNNLNDRAQEINKLIEDALSVTGFQPTLIHSVYWHSGRAAMYFAQKGNIPFVHTVISNGMRKKLSGFKESSQQIETEKVIYQKADTIIVISEQEKNDIITLYNIAPQKVKVVGRGVDNLFIKDLFDKNGTLLAKPL